MTYAAPLKAKLRLDVYEEVEGQKRLKNAIEKEVYLGELPIMTPLGTFVINGAERVVVSQLHRSPGVVFEEDTHPNGQRLFSARIIPFRGSWVEFTIDIHDVIYVHIDKKKKFPATALLRAFGHGNNADILKLFFATKELNITGKLEGRQEKREVLGSLLAVDVREPRGSRGEPLGAVGDELTQERLNEMRHKGVKSVTVFAGYTTIDVREEEQPTTTRDRSNYVLAFDAADPETGEVVAEGGSELTDALRKKLIKAGVHKVEVLLPAGRSESRRSSRTRWPRTRPTARPRPWSRSTPCCGRATRPTSRPRGSSSRSCSSTRSGTTSGGWGATRSTSASSSRPIRTTRS